MPRRLLNEQLLSDFCSRGSGNSLLRGGAERARPVEIGLGKKLGMIFLEKLAQAAHCIRVEIELVPCPPNQPGFAEGLEHASQAARRLQSKTARLRLRKFFQPVS